MKKNLFYLFALICSMSLFTACSDDDEAPDYSKVIESEMAGNYKGTLTVTVEGTTMPSEPQKIKIEKAGPSAINLSLANFSFMGITIGNVELKNCVLSQNGNVYTFTGTQDLKVDALSCTINAKGTIANSAVKVDMDIDATVGGLKQSVKVVYEGTRLTGSESSEAKITDFNIDNALIVGKPIINEEAGTITFRVDEDAVDEDLVALVPTFKISDNATVEPASGVKQDFSKGKQVTYVVTAENGTERSYVVFVAGRTQTYDFESGWTTEGYIEEKGIEPYDVPESGWATSNVGVWFIRYTYQDVYNGGYPVLKTDNAKSGQVAVDLVTLDTKGKAGVDLGFFKIPAIPKVTSGSLFLGTFETDIQNTLNSTKFGNPYYKKPISIQFFYKYTPGNDYYLCVDPTKANEVTLDATKTDECSVTAVLYEVPYFETEDPNDPNNKEYDKRLTGANLYTATDQIVAIGTFTSGAQPDYKEVTLNLEYKKEYDSNKKYRFAVIFSSSKDGDKFSGAPGSTLTVDALTILSE